MEEKVDEQTPLLRGNSNERSTMSPTNKFGLIVAGYAFLFTTILLATFTAAFLAIDLKDQKDISESSTSVIISVYTYAYVLSCIVSPKLDDRFSSLLIMVVSGTILIIIQIFFAYLQDVPAPSVIPTAIIIRALSGFTAGIYENVFASWVIRRFKERIGVIVSIAEAVISAGFLSGPLAGGFLFKITNSLCKTQLIGLVPATLLYIVFTITALRLGPVVEAIPEQGGSSELSTSSPTSNRGSFIRVLKSWQLSYILLQTFWLTLFECLPTSILAPYLQQTYTNYSPAFLAGIILSAKGLAYTMGSIPAGYITDKPKFTFTTFIFYVVAPLMVGISLIVSGLQTFIPGMKPSLIRLIIPFLFVSFGSGIGSGPMLRFILSLWKGLHPEEATDYTTYLTSIFLVTYSLGEAIGVNVGGVLYSVISFEQILGLWGCVSIVYFLTNVMFVLCLRNKPYMTYVRRDAEKSKDSSSKSTHIQSADPT